MKVGDSLAVTLPASVCRALNIQRGDVVTIGVFEENTVVVRRLTRDDLKNIQPEQIIYGN